MFLTSQDVLVLVEYSLQPVNLLAHNIQRLPSTHLSGRS